MSRTNPYVRLEQFLDRKCCPGTSKMIMRHIHHKGSVKMPANQLNGHDIAPLLRNGVIEEILIDRKRRVTLTSFALSMIDDTQH